MKKILVALLLLVSGCRDPGCHDSARVMSWLHFDAAECAHPQHMMSVERVGLKVIMRCTCARRSER